MKFGFFKFVFTVCVFLAFVVIGSTFFIKVFKDEDRLLVFCRQRPFETTFYYKSKRIIVFSNIILFIKLILQQITVEFF